MSASPKTRPTAPKQSPEGSEGQSVGHGGGVVPRAQPLPSDAREEEDLISAIPKAAPLGLGDPRGV